MIEPLVARSTGRSGSFFEWFLFSGYSGDSLGLFRLYFGWGFFIFNFTQFAVIFSLEPFGAEFRYLELIWYFDLLNIERNIPWLIIPVFLALSCATILFAIGKSTRISIVIMIVSVFYLQGVRDSMAGDIHHRHLVPLSILFLLLFSKAWQVRSVDSNKKQFRPLEEWEASWPIRAAQIHIVMFYFWALVAKLRVAGLDWFEDGGQIQYKLIERSLRAGFDASGELVQLGTSYTFAQQTALVAVVGALVVIFELLAPIVLFWRRLSVKIAFLIGATFFHISNYLLLNVQFYFYPFVFVAFFDLVPFHQKILNFWNSRNAAQQYSPE